MASCFNNHNEGPEPNAKLSTTFVQADPSNFQAVVQKLTGATSTFQQQFTSSTHKLPISNPSGRQAKKPALCEVGHHISVVHHKLHERRKAGRKLEITLKSVARDGEVVMSSPVSTLDGRGRSLGTPVEEEEKAIAEKGYYLHPSPISIRGSEPQLLALFPLNSPKND